MPSLQGHEEAWAESTRKWSLASETAWHANLAFFEAPWPRDEIQGSTVYFLEAEACHATEIISGDQGRPAS